ncbi:hypothetical protein PV10_03312 [Exophiala mesophila]|uniref:Copper-fist domain-containing protein n=1 Tax=Exophiala mesophila TaxID=212818 RepID=A0A0D1ZNY5_EXOME|nr:uncharacterized protein PV10_03312 [Exophiala mesophila]KIV95689.1 hypothetical protein PV10_03312 [Exophiala mesophila]
MLINGEKFACEACVRGHRVSSCHHQDRPLVHVNKKGRPVSQCQHCRGLRKARSQHVKCECHDKAHGKEDCPQDKTENKTEPHTCCCQHGSRCTCSLKKDHLDPVPEDIPQLLQPKDHPKDHHKPRPNHNSHESKPTIFTNGHHKPVHKFNDAHNQLGTPYKIPSRSNSLHGHREIAQRSTDSLPLTKFSTKPFQESPLHNSMTDAVSIMQRKVKSEHNSPVLSPQRYPVVNPTIRDLALPIFDPNAYSYSPFGTDSPGTQNNSQQNSQNGSQLDLTLPERFPDTWFMTYEQAQDYEPVQSSFYNNDLASIDWSTYNLEGSNSYTPPPKDNSPYMSQQPTYNPQELSNHINRIGINSSSGEPSEADQQSPSTGWTNDRATSNDRQISADNHFNDLSSFGGDDSSDRFRHSSASSYYGTPQANLLANDNLQNYDIDDYLRQVEAETQRMQMQNQFAQMQTQLSQQDSQSQPSPRGPGQPTQQPPSRLSSVSRGITPSISSPGSTGTGEHSFTIREAQRYAHMDNMRSDPSPLTKTSIPAANIVDDPSWSVAPDMSNPDLVLNDEQEDEDWVR